MEVAVARKVRERKPSVLVASLLSAVAAGVSNLVAVTVSLAPRVAVAVTVALRVAVASMVAYRVAVALRMMVRGKMGAAERRGKRCTRWPLALRCGRWTAKRR